MSEADGAASDDRSDAERLREKLLDLLIFMPTGLAVSVAEELPKLAARGRERLGVQVSSARAVGEFVVRMGGQELRRISARVPPPAGRQRPPPTPRPVASPGPVPESERAVPTVPTSAAGHPTHYGPTMAAPRTTSAAAGPSSTGPTGAGRPVQPDGQRQRARRRHPRHSGLRHAVGLAGRATPRWPQPRGVGVGPGLRDVDAWATHHPQPCRPAARGARLDHRRGGRRLRGASGTGEWTWKRCGRQPTATAPGWPSWPAR